MKIGMKKLRVLMGKGFIFVVVKSPKLFEGMIARLCECI